MMLRWFWRSILLALVAGILIPLVYLLWLPYVPAMKTHNPTFTPLMALREKQARDAGHTLKTIYLWRDLDDISPNLVHAALLSEDDMFYQHHGFDMEQIRIAAQIDWEKKRFAYGGSTITQQLARSLYLSPRKNLLRKAKEALITLLLERYLSKDRIMELYLNVIEWGKGIYGAEAASQAYFQKSAKELTPDEAASLASILPSPRRWNPASERQFMARRRTRLVARMRRAGFLPPEESTSTVVPEDIQRMAEEAGRYLDAQENPAQIQSSNEPASTDPAEPVQTPDGLFMPAPVKTGADSAPAQGN